MKFENHYLPPAMIVHRNNGDVVDATAHLPGPMQNTPIGFSSFSLVDAARTERFNKRNNRNMQVLVWYPGEQTPNATRKTYFHNVRQGKNLLLSLLKPRRISNAILTNSFIDIPLSAKRERYPVLLFSHDLGMLPEYYTRMMEHLASEGYIVFSINHAYFSESCPVLNDKKEKETVRFKKRVGLKWSLAKLKARSLKKGISYDQKWTISKRLLPQWRLLAEMNSDFTRDRNFLLSFLEQLNSSFLFNQAPYNLFARRLDLKKIGVFGHGWGGTSAVQSLIQDSRVKAAVNLDGFQFAHALNNTVAKPLLMVYSQENAGINEGIYFCSSEFDSYIVSNSKHGNFSDVPFLKTGSPECSSAFYDTLNLTVHFFDRHVKNVDHVGFSQVKQR
jgi:hypothetical protein